MKKNFVTEVNLTELLKEINSLEFLEDGSKALMACKPCQTIDSWLDDKTYPNIRKAIDEICGLRQCKALYVMINKIPPGVKVPVHSDTLLPHIELGVHPKLERWHLPIITNGNCTWWDSINGSKILVQGLWCGPVPYWAEHKVENNGKTDRIHLVVDLDRGVKETDKLMQTLTVESKPVESKPVDVPKVIEKSIP